MLAIPLCSCEGRHGLANSSQVWYICGMLIHSTDKMGASAHQLWVPTRWVPTVMRADMALLIRLRFGIFAECFQVQFLRGIKHTLHNHEGKGSNSHSSATFFGD